MQTVCQIPSRQRRLAEVVLRLPHRWFCLIGVAAALAIFFQLWLFGDIGAALTRRIREASFKSLLRQNIAFFDKEENATGEFCTAPLALYAPCDDAAA